MSRRLLSPMEVARLLGVSTDSVRRWAREGLIKAVRVGATRGYSVREVERVRKQRELTRGSRFPRAR
ncbi:MAG: MerR family transcriptional regulator [Armatimonadota bacterium]|nr:MerR family transcriptional regulator [Armatimonadota bacterium]